MDDTTMGGTEDNSMPIIKTEILDDDYSRSSAEELVPEMMVTVQVEELENTQTLDLDCKPKQEKKPITKKKENGVRKRKKHTESPEARKERLERDRARKSWARKNETPEQRKARLDYHKKYKRKSRAKPKDLPQSMKCERCPAKFNEIEEWRQHLQIHPWREDTFLKIGVSKQDKPPSETENIIVKVEPLDIDDVNYNADIHNSDFTPNESDSTPNETNKLLKYELTYPTQCAIVSKLFKGRSIDDICKLYNVTPNIVNELWEDRDKYEVQKLGHRSHKHLNAKIEKSILEWLQNQRDNHIQISGRMIQNAAEGYAKELGFIEFDGSRKWLDRFKKKHDIIFGTRKRDYTATPDNKVKTQFFVEQWADAREGFTNDDIYTADEVGLFYNPSKNRIKKLRGKKFVQGCVKDRLSIFLCTNASGTDKKKLLVCGTEDPLQHLHIDPQTLPVMYIRHAEAHFTTRIFENYVTCWNKELQQRNKKALLVLDRATIHSKLQLSHLKLLFVPYKSKNSLVPIRNGVYSRFRTEFRRLILEDKVMKCLSGLDRNITCLEALSMLEKAWENTPPEVITMSLVSIGYDIDVPKNIDGVTSKMSENNEESLCEILKNYDCDHYFTDLSLLDQYLTVDEDLLTGRGTNASVFGGNHKAAPKKEVEKYLPIGTVKQEFPTMEATVKRTLAKDLEMVKQYLQSKDKNFGSYCALVDVESFVKEPRCSDT